MTTIAITTTTMTTTNTQFLPPRPAAPAITTPVRDTTTTHDENEFFETEFSFAHLGRSLSRSALTLLWEAVDERDSADYEYANLMRSESEGASGAFHCRDG